MKVILAKPRGFCAGVGRAIGMVELALKTHRPPVYVRKEIVHNRFVVEDLKQRGAVFVEETAEVPEGAVLVFSAHGVAPGVWEETKARNIEVIDATCPLVTKVHLEVRRFLDEGCELILIGHAGHEEVVGTMGEAPGKIRLVTSAREAAEVTISTPEKLAVITQTTLSTSDATEIIQVLRKRFPRLRTPASDDICYATRSRQQAVLMLAHSAPVVLVVGAPNSSNSKRLQEVAQGAGAKAYLINHSREVDWAWFEGVDAVGITAGASAPDSLVRELVNLIIRRYGGTIEEIEAVPESVQFRIPGESGN